MINLRLLTLAWAGSPLQTSFRPANADRYEDNDENDDDDNDDDDDDAKEDIMTYSSRVRDLLKQTVNNVGESS